MRDKMESDISDERSVLLRRYWVFVKPYTLIILVIILLGILSFSVPLAIPWLTKVLIDEVLPGEESFWSLKKVIIVMGSVFVLGVIVNFARNYITAKLTMTPRTNTLPITIITF